MSTKTNRIWMTLALLVAAVHATAMISAGGAIAWGVYRWMGLKFLSASWFNLDVAWALSLIIVGAIGIAAALAG